MRRFVGEFRKCVKVMVLTRVSSITIARLFIISATSIAPFSHWIQFEL